MGTVEKEKIPSPSLVSRINPFTIVFPILTLIFLGMKAFPLGGNFIGGPDVFDYSFWNVYFFREQILSGSFPLWNPYMYCGHPYFANPANFVLYPFILLYVIFPLPWAFNIDLFVHLLIAGTGAFYFVRNITGSQNAGLISAIIYAFGGHLIDRIVAGHLTFVHSAALLPWVFYFIERALRTNRILNFILAGILLGLMVLTGNTQGCLYTAYFASLFFLVYYFIKFNKFNHTCPK